MDIHSHDQVYTADKVYLGEARQIYQRDPAETDPILRLYGHYLLVENLDYGDDYFIPMDFVGGHDAEGRVVLKVKMRQVMEETWTRQPNFVAHGRATAQPLAD